MVMEATGVYHERLATELYESGFSLSLANPHRSREFARGMGIMTKTDKVDAYMLACYAFLKKPHLWESPGTEIRYLGALLRRRDVLLGDALREENRLEKYLSTDTSADIPGGTLTQGATARNVIAPYFTAGVVGFTAGMPGVQPYCVRSWHRVVVAALITLDFNRF